MRRKKITPKVTGPFTKMVLIGLALLCFLPSFYNLTLKAYAVLTWDKMQAKYVGTEGRYPKFGVDTRSEKRVVSPSVIFSNDYAWDPKPVHFLVNPRNPNEYYMYQFVGLVFAPFVGICLGCLFLLFWFLSGPNITEVDRRTHRISSKFPRAYKLLLLGSVLSLLYSRFFVVFYFFSAYIDPKNYFNQAVHFPRIYFLESVLFFPGVFLIIIPDLIREKGKIAQVLSFFLATVFFGILTLAYADNNFSDIFNIYFGVVVSRLLIHFENDPSSKSTAYLLTFIRIPFFLLTVALAAEAPIPAIGMTPELQKEIADFTSLGDGLTYKVLFAGGFYYLLVLCTELRVIFGKKMKFKIEFG